MDGTTVNSDAFAQHPLLLEHACRIAASWNRPHVWRWSYSLKNVISDSERLGRESRKSANRLREAGGPCEHVERAESNSNQAFERALQAKDELRDRELELIWIRNLLLDFAAELAMLVPYANFQGDLPSDQDLEQCAKQMFQLETKLRVLAAGVDRDGTQTEAKETKAGNSHSPDFRSVRWSGMDYTFTATQAKCIEVLWEAWESGSPAVGQEYILEQAGSESSRLYDLFKKHPAWKAMIVSIGNGGFRLSE